VDHPRFIKLREEEVKGIPYVFLVLGSAAGKSCPIILLDPFLTLVAL
jgi:hypothetical protein